MVTLKKLASAWFVIAIVFLIPLIVWSSTRNPPLSRTGAPGEGTCASCHGGGPGGGRVTIASASGNTYTPGVTQHLSVTISDANAAAWGYEMTAVQATSTSTGAGTFVAIDTASSVRASGTKSYAEQANDFPNTTASHTYRERGGTEYVAGERTSTVVATGSRECEHQFTQPEHWCEQHRYSSAIHG